MDPARLQRWMTVHHGVDGELDPSTIGELLFSKSGRRLWISAQNKLQLIKGGGSSRRMGVLDDIALFAQISGVDAIMLFELAAHLLRLPQCEAEFDKLEECERKLRALLRRGDVATQLTTETMVMATVALTEAALLLGSYRGRSLWCRVQTARSMEARLRDMKGRVNSMREHVLPIQAIVHAVHANLRTGHGASDTNNAMNHHVISDQLHGAETSDSASDSQTSDNTGQGEADDQSDNTKPGGLESM